MAELVGVFATSHSPVLITPKEDWPELEPKADLPLVAELEGRVRQQWPQHENRYAAAIAELRRRIADVRPDVLLVVGSDQRENFGSRGAPVFEIFLGDKLDASAGNRRTEGPDAHRISCPVPVSLGRDILVRLCESGFDIAHSSEPTHDFGVGHAVTWPLRFLDLPLPDLQVLPFITNVWDPPNVPGVGRCVSLGRALREAITGAASDARVAVLASGGLSHLLLDENLDDRVLDALRSSRPDRWSSISDDELREAHAPHGLPLSLNGTVEITDWIIADTCADTAADVIDYVAAYRTETGIGVGMCFASWPELVQTSAGH
ncbi:DODA-type extradiol aromatic ring-opening family dioxygenase [Prauserella flavalba]|uniref:DODA-type extradiol aromatic ring-opening family dioxygenase n=1 Tax=Prauserella flavalba TaxID=1477506 RepID=UPI0036ED9A89